MPMKNSNHEFNLKALGKVNLIFFFVILFIGLFIVRLFYVQVIKYSYYKHSALIGQLEQAKIPATRGLIEAHQGNQIMPIVLNQELFTIYADPSLIKNPSTSSSKIAAILGSPSNSYEKLLSTKHSRYIILAKKITQVQSDKIIALKLPGIGSIGQDYRTYPQGDLAGQLLGFVNENGKGTYGIEQYFNKELSGTPGYLKAITDVNGVPLASSKGNIDVPPVDGSNTVLTIDIAMQKQVQDIIKKVATDVKSPLVSAVIMDPNSGAIKAMANYPSYNPAEYSKVTDSNLFNNAAVSNPIEVGSIMKVLTTTSALDQKVIKQDTTYNDPGSWLIDGFRIKNVEEDGGAGVRSIEDLLNLSLNTGATWLLMQMGNGQINKQARQAWYDYETKHFRLGQDTGIEQGYEAKGVFPQPNIAYQSDEQQNLNYANTTFGQAMTASALQMDSALSSIINGGTYYKPHLLDGTIDNSGNVTYKKPIVVSNNVVSSSTTSNIIPLLQQVVKGHYQMGFKYLNFPSNYVVGGKTGTAQIANPNGGYQDHLFNGTYIGFVGGDKPQYAIAIFVTTPTVPGYAGSYAAQPIFGSIAHMLIDESYVRPIGQ